MASTGKAWRRSAILLNSGTITGSSKDYSVNIYSINEYCKYSEKHFTLNMSKVRDKDLILKRLASEGLANHIEYVNDNDDFFKLLELYEVDLKIDSYVSVDEGREMRDGIVFDYKRARITELGLAFIRNGGYTGKRNKEAIDSVWNRGNILVALCTAIVSYCTYNKTGTDTRSYIELKQSTDSLKKQLARIDSVLIRIKQDKTSTQKIGK